MSRSINIIIALLLSAVAMAEEVTYTVASRESVTVTGDAPTNSQATYSQTYNKKQQLTAGNAATLLLQGFDGCMISSVSLTMHSNQKAGAGYMQMTIGETAIWTIDDQPFNASAWYGSYINTFVRITRLFAPAPTVGNNEQIKIEIGATTNSLYIESFTISYEPFIPTERYTVSFTTHHTPVNPIQEDIIGGGIILPSAQDKQPDWFFIGWTEQQIEPTTYMPRFHKAGDIYYPTKDCTLYALYSNTRQQGSSNIWQDISYQSDQYTLVDVRSQCNMRGSTQNGKVGANSVKTLYKEDQYHYSISHKELSDEDYFYITFHPDSTALIYHTIDQCYIAPPTDDRKTFGAMSSTEQWRYRVLQDSTVIFYHHYTDKTRVLYTDYDYAHDSEGKIYFCNQILNLDSYHERGFALFPEYIEVRAVYTSIPSSTGIETTKNNAFCVKQNRVINKSHETIYIYNAQGLLLLKSNENDIALTSIHGFLLITNGTQTIKHIIP